jgi:hypothetical protein
LRGVGIGLWFAVHGDLLLTAVYLILEQVIFKFEVGNAPLTISTSVVYRTARVGSGLELVKLWDN